jgi:tetratricopeptide (TPR) repeat protein
VSNKKTIMLKKIMLNVLAAMFVLTGFSQTDIKTFNKPNFAEIEKTIKDKDSPFFYTKLIERYTNNDTALTTEEYRYLYYGFSFKDGYSPYGKSALNDELRKNISEKNTEKIIELEKKILAEFPFNLRDLNTLTNALDKKGDKEQAGLYYKKLLGVAKAIMSTGNGFTDSTAMYVISVDQEYDMISLLGYKFGGSQTLINNKFGSMDKMKLEKNDANIEAIYFNVDRLFASMQKMFGK